MIIKDEIHGNIELNEFEKKIIDTKEFQRLRRIKQLAMTYLVYPSATHTRFEHAIGTLHIADRICKKFSIEEELTQKIRLYALLHDIGHCAFSHESEKVLEPIVGTHEEIGKRKLLNGELADILNEQFKPKEIVDIGNSFYGQIVSSDLGADRMDYLLRDSRNTGVAYGIIDLDRVLHTLFLDEKKKLMGIDSSGLEAAESILIARFMMFSTVYLHHTVRIASAMIQRAIYSAIKNGLSPEHFLDLSDEEALLALFNSGNEDAKFFADSLSNRKLLKAAYKFNYSKGFDKNSSKIESSLQSQAKGKILIDLPPTFSKPVSIVVNLEGTYTPLKQLSQLVQSLESAEESRKQILILSEEFEREKIAKLSEKLFA